VIGPAVIGYHYQYRKLSLPIEKERYEDFVGTFSDPGSVFGFGGGCGTAATSGSRNPSA
jgi:hypothetical protein